MNVPGLSITTWPDGQLSSFAWIAGESFPPLGESVAHTVVRLGTPPLDINPGFHGKFLSAGMIWPRANCEEKTRPAKTRTDARAILDKLKCENGQTRVIIKTPGRYGDIQRHPLARLM